MESVQPADRSAVSDGTPRERLARILTLLGRVRLYWRSTLVLTVVGVGLSLALAMTSKRAWRSETTLLYRESIVTGRDNESASVRAARLGPRLRDMVTARPRLTAVVEEFDLYPHKQARSMLDAVEELADNISFKARASDTYVISFIHDDPRVAQAVTARLAELMISDHGRETLDTAKMTRDFLRREVQEATTRVDQASRALAIFLAHNPQFQWGLNDNPYAPVPAAAMPGAAAAPGKAGRSAPRDPVLADLEAKLGRVEAQLGVPSAALAASSPAVAEAQRERDAAAADLAKAETELAERMRTLTPAHPDAAAARSRVESARRTLAAADAKLGAARLAASAIEESSRAPELSAESKAELARERASLRSQITARRAKLAGGRDHDDGEKSKSAQPQAAELAVVELETDWHRLKLDLERAREHLRVVQQSERTADIAAAAAERKSQSEMMILDPAYLPTRPDRGRGRVFFAGCAIVFLLAFGIAGARVLANDTLFDVGDVAAAGAPPVLVTLPRLGASAPATKAPRGIVVTPACKPTPGRPATNGRRRREPGSPATTGDGGRSARKSHPVTLPMLWAPPPGAPAKPERRPLATLRLGRMGGAEVTTEMVRVVAPAIVFDEPVREEPEIEVVGTVVDLDDEGPDKLLRRAPAAALAALRVLRHRLEQRRAGGRLVVSVVSPGPEDGKTLLAIHLALVLAEAERASVALVDANLSRPSVAKALGVRIPEPLGLSAQVRRRMTGVTAPWRVVRLAPSLAALAEPGPEAAYPTALHSSHFDAALGALHRAYDFVVVDGPSVLESGDANVVEQVSDTILLVARSAVTKGTALRRATDQIGDRRILGVVLNDSRG